MLQFHCLSVFNIHAYIVLKQQNISTQFILHITALYLYEMALKFLSRQISENCECECEVCILGTSVERDFLT